jgi:hypothetical protein
MSSPGFSLFESQHKTFSRSNKGTTTTTTTRDVANTGQPTVCFQIRFYHQQTPETT